LDALSDYSSEDGDVPINNIYQIYYQGESSNVVDQLLLRPENVDIMHFEERDTQIVNKVYRALEEEETPSDLPELMWSMTILERKLRSQLGKEKGPLEQLEFYGPWNPADLRAILTNR